MSKTKPVQKQVSKPTKKTAAKKRAVTQAKAKPTAKAVKTVVKRASLRDRLLAYALGLPGAREEHPWGEAVAKVGAKTFAFFGVEKRAHLSVKLPTSGGVALELPFVEATPGLGRGGWVTATLAPDASLDVDMLLAWIEESYRALAPKKQVIELDERKETLASSLAPVSKRTLVAARTPAPRVIPPLPSTPRQTLILPKPSTARSRTNDDAV